MPQVLGAIGGFFSWVGGLGGGGAAAGGAATAGTAAAAGAGTVTATAATAFAAGAGLTGTSTFISQVASAAFQLAVSTALSAVLQPNMAATGGAPLNWKADEQAPVPYIFGETATGGSVVFKEVYGGEKARHLRHITVLSIGPIEAVTEFRANNVVTTFDGSRRAVGYYAGGMWSDTKLGTTSEAAHTISTAPYTLTESGVWDSDHKLPGLATNQLIMRFAAERYSTGPAEPLFVVQGPVVYDPREDSTVPGGSGSQRADDRSTWTFAGRDNAYLQGLSWALGIRDQGQVVMGAGMPAWAIDVPAFIEGANVAEANGWTCGGMAYSSDASFTVLEQLLRSSGGKPIQLGGALSCVVSTPRVSLATLTGGDIIGSIDMAGPPNWRDRFNTAFPRYREADQDWQFIALDPVAVPSAVAADGGEERRTPEVDLAYVQNKDQAAQIAAYDILDSREAGPWEFAVRPRWRALKPGDCITLDIPELGINSQKLLIRERTRNPMTGQRKIRCWTETDAKHAEALGITGSVPTPAVYDDVLPGIEPPDSGSWTATGGSISANGGQVPVIFVTGINDSVEAADLLVRYRKDGSSDDWEEVSWPVTAAKMAIPTVGPAEDYEVEFNYRSVRGVVGETWTPDTSPATTGGLIPQDLSISSGKIQDGSVTTGKIQDASVTTGKIQDASVTTGKIVDASVTTGKIQDASVTTGKIVDASVTNGKIQDAAISTPKIVDEAVTILTQQTRPNGFGGGGAIGIAWRTGAFTTFTKLDEYTFSYSGEGAIQMLWTGLIQWQRNASSRVLFFICLNQTPTYSFGSYGNFQGDPIEYQGNQDALTVPAILPINLSGITPGSNTLSIWAQSVENTATIPVLGVGSAFLDITGKK